MPNWSVIELVVIPLTESEMKKTTFAAMLLSSANLVMAAPVYLDCVTKFDNPPPGAASEFRFSVKIDEASGDITHTDADGSAFNAKGFFTAREVGYKQIDGDSSISERETSYKIDRTNLAFTRTYTVKYSEQGMRTLQSADDLARSSVTKGTCKITDMKNRQF